MAPKETVEFNDLPHEQQKNIGTALEHFMFRFLKQNVHDEAVEGDKNVRKHFEIRAGRVCDFVSRRGSRYVLGEAKGENDINTAREQIENTIAAIVARDRAAVFECLAVFIRRGAIYPELPLNSTEGLARYLELAGVEPEFRLASAHLARRGNRNHHVLREPSGDPCLPILRPSKSDKWGISRLVPPEIRLYVTTFRRPA